MIMYIYTLIILQVKNCTDSPDFADTDKEAYGVSIGSTVR